MCAILFSSSSSANTISSHDVLVGQQGWLFYSGEYLNSRYLLNAEKAIKNIGELSKALKLNSIDLYVVIIPNKVDLFGSYLPINFKLEKSIIVEYPTLENLLKKYNIEHVNILETLKEYKENPINAQIWRKSDTHWTNTGAFQSAKKIADSIKFTRNVKSLPIFESYISTDTISSVSIAPTDLYRMLTDVEKDQYPKVDILERYLSISALHNIGLLDDSLPKIVLIGTSFSMPQNGNLAKFISYHLKRDILDYSIGGIGYWTPMEQYLTSYSFKMNTPKTIIWEIPEREFIETSQSLIDEDSIEFQSVISQLRNR